MEARAAPGTEPARPLSRPTKIGEEITCQKRSGPTPHPKPDRLQIAPVRMREELISLLSRATELEHGLACISALEARQRNRQQESIFVLKSELLSSITALWAKEGAITDRGVRDRPF